MDPSSSPAQRSPTEMKEKEKEKQRHHHHHSNTTRKKSGSLPLIMFLSMDNEESARPDCVNASNPFHKCTHHCSPRTEDGKGSKKMAEQTNPKCVNSSNPFHECGNNCFKAKTPNGAEAKIGIGGNERRVTVHTAPQPNSVHPLCPNASNPFHVCVELCLQKITQKDKSRDIVSRTRIAEKVVADKERKDGVHFSERAVHPMCSNASNPFHVCVEACSQTIPAGKDGVKKFNPLGSRVPIAKGKNREVKTASNGKVLANCKYASNPFHNCDEYCFQSGQGKFQVKKRHTEKRKIIAKNVEENASPSKVDAAIEEFLNKPSEEDLADEAKSVETHEDVKRREIIKIDPECREETGGDIKRTEMTNIEERSDHKSQLRNSSPVLSGFMLVMIYMIHIIVIAIMHRRKK